MPDVFKNAKDRKALVDDVAARKGIAPWVIEKDLWVCWTLARLSEMPGLPSLTFKGGTSLSKVHNVIERFSEDIDLTFARDGWGFDGDRDPTNRSLSGKKRAGLLEGIQSRSEGVVRDIVVPGLRAVCETTAGSTGWSVDIDPEDKQAVLFAYPEPGATYSKYAKAQVKIEFGARGDPWPTQRRTVRPYIEEVHADTAPTAIVEVSTLEPERTFWEKATLLHQMYNVTLDKPEKAYERHSRHVYDVHRIWCTPTIRDVLAKGRDLLRQVAEHKTIFFKEPKAKYELVAEFTLNCKPHAALEKTLRADFEQMQSEMMFFANAKIPSFDEMNGTLRELEELVAGWKPAGPSLSA